MEPLDRSLWIKAFALEFLDQNLLIEVFGLEPFDGNRWIEVFESKPLHWSLWTNIFLMSVSVVAVQSGSLDHNLTSQVLLL